MIKLTDEYFIDIDDYNYTLCKQMKTIDKRTGKPNQKALGYYGNMRDCLKAYAEARLTESVTTDEAMSLGTAIGIMTSMHEELVKQIKAAVPDPDVYAIL